MNSRHPNRPKRAAKHKSARKLLPRKPAASEAPAIAALDLPAGQPSTYHDNHRN
ncbi:hypothetical protein HBI81_032820 [Parastagonospora nodorum]|nr:hypothetical protein HBI58_006430 [Parastagonospora nodorum]KAH6541889.1 hypothetical protein HBI81_032820 [Parastagonospora nodorum]